MALLRWFYNPSKRFFWTKVLVTLFVLISVLEANQKEIPGAIAMVVGLWLAVKVFKALCDWLFEGMPPWVFRCAFVAVTVYGLTH